MVGKLVRLFRVSCWAPWCNLIAAGIRRALALLLVVFWSVEVTTTKPKVEEGGEKRREVRQREARRSEAKTREEQRREERRGEEKRKKNAESHREEKNPLGHQTHVHLPYIEDQGAFHPGIPGHSNSSAML